MSKKKKEERLLQVNKSDRTQDMTHSSLKNTTETLKLGRFGRIAYANDVCNEKVV
jgi:hypothetical protein